MPIHKLVFYNSNMIKTTIKHFIMDYALHTLFNGLAKNFFSASKDFLSNVKIGDTSFMEVYYNDYIVKGPMEIVDVVNINGYDKECNKVSLTQIHLQPQGTVNIIDKREYEDDTEGMNIEYYMNWIEPIDGTEDEYVGEFAYVLAITTEDIIKSS